MINRIYPLRKCNTLKKELCLYYHINECLGYCCKKIDKEVIDEMKHEIISFLKGDASIISKKIETEMNKASESMNYERALELKNMLEDINVTLRKQKIDLNNNNNFDLVNYYYNNNYLCIEIFFIRKGLLFGRHNEIFSSMGDISNEIIEYLIKFYDKGIVPSEIVIPEDIDENLLKDYFKVKVTVPKKGKLKKLVDLAKENAKEQMNLEEETLTRNDKERIIALKELQELLGIENLHRIESFDNSHLFGTFYVGGMVVFDDFLPNKDLYRKYKISSDVKDDLSAMKEVLYRRYYKTIMNESYKPDLIVMDGGALQVSVAKEMLQELNLYIPIIGLAKDDKHKTSYIINENLEKLEVAKDSKLFLFLTRIQDEVHRYAITYHRNIKAKGTLSSILDSVPGIGEVRKKELLKKFGSLKKIKETSVDDLSEIIGDNLAKKLKRYLKM